MSRLIISSGPIFPPRFDREPLPVTGESKRDLFSYLQEQWASRRVNYAEGYLSGFDDLFVPTLVEAREYVIAEVLMGLHGSFVEEDGN